MTVIKFVHNVPLADTMEFDAIYPEGLQFTLPEKEIIRNTPGAVFVWMRVDGTLAGEAYGVPVSTYDESIEGLGELTDEGKQGAIYCYSNTVLPPFQGRRLGYILKAHWLGLVAAKGFKTIYGHARPGGSHALNARFGAVFLGDFPDWYGTRETYKMYRLTLHQGA